MNLSNKLFNQLSRTTQNTKTCISLWCFNNKPGTNYNNNNNSNTIFKNNKTSSNLRPFYFSKSKYLVNQCYSTISNTNTTTTTTTTNTTSSTTSTNTTSTSKVQSSINTQYTGIEIGQANTSSYRFYFKSEKSNQLISPFHDIPLYQNEQKSILNMIVEIPRWTNAKMEINKKEILNPISQDIKHNELRFVHNIFPYYGYITNYGALPQTWEDPNKLDELTQLKGDNDPLDVCEIGSVKQKRGSVIGVKVLGALGLIDEGETDWKIIVIDHMDELAAHVNTMKDVEMKLPGLMDSIRDWFKIYKIPSGKPANTFAFNGNYLERESAINIIEHNHKAWLELFKQNNNNNNNNNNTNKNDISLFNSTLTNNTTISTEQANSIISQSKKIQEYAQFDSELIDKLCYVNRNIK